MASWHAWSAWSWQKNYWQRDEWEKGEWNNNRWNQGPEGSWQDDNWKIVYCRRPKIRPPKHVRDAEKQAAGEQETMEQEENERAVAWAGGLLAEIIPNSNSNAVGDPMPPAYPPPDVISDISTLDMSREEMSREEMSRESLIPMTLAWIKEELIAITNRMANGSLNDFSLRYLRELKADWSDQRDHLKQAQSDCQKIIDTLENILSPTPVQSEPQPGPGEPGQLFKNSIAVLKRSRTEAMSMKENHRDGAVKLKAVKQELED